jgi:hypothetical protein
MVEIPAGEFISVPQDCEGLEPAPPRCARHVAATTVYHLDRRQVRAADFARCVAAKACPPPPHTHNSGACQARVPLASARAYCRWVGKRLPTLVEFEKAYRGTDGRLSPWGNEASSCEKHGLRKDRLVCPNVMDECFGNTLLPATTWGPYGVAELAGSAEWAIGELWHLPNSDDVVFDGVMRHGASGFGAGGPNGFRCAR